MARRCAIITFHSIFDRTNPMISIPYGEGRVNHGVTAQRACEQLAGGATSPPPLGSPRWSDGQKLLAQPLPPLSPRHHWARPSGAMVRSYWLSLSLILSLRHHWARPGGALVRSYWLSLALVLSLRHHWARPGGAMVRSYWLSLARPSLPAEVHGKISVPLRNSGA